MMGMLGMFKANTTPLFPVATIVLLLVFLPYTLVLLFGQWMQAFLDAYHGPFRKGHHYWSGLLLVFLGFAFNALGNPNVNLLAIIMCTAALTLLIEFTGKIYVNWYLQGLEASFVMNSLVFSLLEAYQTALVFRSVGAALVEFIGIIIYHLTM